MDALIQEKKEEKDSTRTIMYSDVIREREELSEQIRALEDLKELGRIYGFDISKPRRDDNREYSLSDPSANINNYRGTEYHRIFLVLRTDRCMNYDITAPLKDILD